MTDDVLAAKRINNGQSEIWFQTQPGMRRIVATNGIFYPLRLLCTPDESEAVRRAFGNAEAVIPTTIISKLIEDFRLSTY